MNKGLLKGLAGQHQWKDYRPLLDVEATGGSPPGTATPSLGTAAGGARQQGRYLYLPESKLVVVRFLLQFSSSGNSGGTGVYIVKLPVPQRLWDAGVPGNSFDEHLGNGYLAFGGSLTFTPNSPVSWITADGPGLSYGGGQEWWAQGVISPFGVILSGSANITSTNTTVNVTWPGSITLQSAPTAHDIILTPTTAGAGVGPAWITNLSTTGFTINLATAAASTATYNWKLLQNSGTGVVLTNINPWGLGGQLDRISGQLVYEAAG